MSEIKRGPVPKYIFENYPVGHIIKLDPLKQSSFKSLLSIFNREIIKDQRHQYKYQVIGKNILATRIK
jgi:hypothetical protein